MKRTRKSNNRIIANMPAVFDKPNSADMLGVKRVAKTRQRGEQTIEYKKLYQSYKKVIIHSLIKKGLGSGEAEEITQEAFAKLIGLNEKRTPSYLKAYVYRVAHNLAIDQFRKNAKTPLVDNASIVDLESYIEQKERSPSVQESLEMKEAARSITLALDELPEKTKKAFVLFKIKGKDYSEIATILNVSESMVRKHVLRAIRQCYDKLEDQH